MSTPAVAPPPPAPPSAQASGWWRRNRWALVGLPVALLLALIGAGDRVRTLWWDQDLRRPSTVEAGGTAEFHQRLVDGAGEPMPIEVQLRLDGVGAATTLPEDMELPAGTRAVQVDLTLSADPDIVLLTCNLALRDAAGTRYQYVSTSWGARQPVAPCVPADTPGPWPSLGDLDDVLSHSDDPPRPRTWSVSPVVVVPDGIEITEVVLWWQLPQYVLLEASGQD